MDRFKTPQGKPEGGKPETKAQRAKRLDGQRGRPEGSGITPAEQMQRDLNLFQAHLNCVSVPDLCQMYQLKPTRIRQIIKTQSREYQRLRDRNPVDVVEEATDQINQGLSQLAAAASQENGHARVTAIIARIDRIIAKMKWLQSTGVIPEKAAELRIQVDGMNMAQNVLSVLERNDLLTPDLMREIHAEIGGGDIDADVVDVEGEELPELPESL